MQVLLIKKHERTAELNVNSAYLAADFAEVLLYASNGLMSIFQAFKLSD